jgi:predicted HTH domain antitoxin
MFGKGSTPITAFANQMLKERPYQRPTEQGESITYFRPPTTNKYEEEFFAQRPVMELQTPQERSELENIQMPSSLRSRMEPQAGGEWTQQFLNQGLTSGNFPPQWNDVYREPVGVPGAIGYTGYQQPASSSDWEREYQAIPARSMSPQTTGDWERQYLSIPTHYGTGSLPQQRPISPQPYEQTNISRTSLPSVNKIKFFYKDKWRRASSLTTRELIKFSTELGVVPKDSDSVGDIIRNLAQHLQAINSPILMRESEQPVEESWADEYQTQGPENVRYYIDGRTKLADTMSNFQLKGIAAEHGLQIIPRETKMDLIRRLTSHLRSIDSPILKPSPALLARKKRIAELTASQIPKNVQSLDTTKYTIKHPSGHFIRLNDLTRPDIIKIMGEHGIRTELGSLADIKFDLVTGLLRMDSTDIQVVPDFMRPSSTTSTDVQSFDITKYRIKDTHGNFVRLRDLTRTNMIKIMAEHGIYANSSDTLGRLQHDLITGLLNTNSPDIQKVSDLGDELRASSSSARSASPRFTTGQPARVREISDILHRHHLDVPKHNMNTLSITRYYLIDGDSLINPDDLSYQQLNAIAQEFGIEIIPGEEKHLLAARIGYYLKSINSPLHYEKLMRSGDPRAKEYTGMDRSQLEKIARDNNIPLYDNEVKSKLARRVFNHLKATGQFEQPTIVQSIPQSGRVISNILQQHHQGLSSYNMDMSSTAPYLLIDGDNLIDPRTITGDKLAFIAQELGLEILSMEEKSKLIHRFGAYLKSIKSPLLYELGMPIVDKRLTEYHNMSTKQLEDIAKQEGLPIYKNEDKYRLVRRIVHHLKAAGKFKPETRHISIIIPTIGVLETRDDYDNVIRILQDQSKQLFNTKTHDDVKAYFRSKLSSLSNDPETVLLMKTILLRNLQYRELFDDFRQFANINDTAQINRKLKDLNYKYGNNSLLYINNSYISVEGIDVIYDAYQNGQISSEDIPILQKLNTQSLDEVEKLADLYMSNFDALTHKERVDMMFILAWLRHHTSSITLHSVDSYDDEINNVMKYVRSGRDLNNLYPKYSEYKQTLDRLNKIVGSNPIGALDYNAAVDFIEGRTTTVPYDFKRSLASIMRSKLYDIDSDVVNSEYLMLDVIENGKDEDFELIVNELGSSGISFNDIPHKQLLIPSQPIETITESQIKDFSKSFWGPNGDYVSLFKNASRANIDRIVKSMEKYNKLYVPDDFDLNKIKHAFEHMERSKYLPKDTSAIKPLIDRLSQMQLITVSTKPAKL